MPASELARRDPQSRPSRTARGRRCPWPLAAGLALGTVGTAPAASIQADVNMLDWLKSAPERAGRPPPEPRPEQAPTRDGASAAEPDPAGQTAATPVIGARRALDPRATFSAQAHLVTSVPDTFAGADVAEFTGAARFHAAGITGQRTVSANIEAGHVWNDHETLGHVSTFVDGPGTFESDADPATPEYDRHATAVGMMFGGRNGGSIQGAWQAGIAPDTDLQSGAIATSWLGPAYSLSFEVSTDTMNAAYGSMFGTADVINSSWGATDTTGSSSLALITDGLQSQNPGTTLVVSAGNSGPGANTVVAPGAGYNAITVGALQNDGANRYDAVADFSSRGPQDYADPVNGVVANARAAVDITASGTALTSAFYGGQTGGNNPGLAGSGPFAGDDFYFGALAGSSFSAPITAGGAALLHSAHARDPELAVNAAAADARVVKAALLNSARKIAGWDNGQTRVGTLVQTTQSLDWARGAGALDLDRAFDQYLSAGTRDLAGLGGGLVDPIGWDYAQLGSGGWNRYEIDALLRGGSTFTATLTWLRERKYDYIGSVADDIAQANLDLIVRDIATGKVAQSVSLYNLVEHLSFVLPATGRYAIDVLYSGNTFDTTGGFDLEQYALAWWAEAPTPGTPLLVLTGAGALLLRRRTRRRPRRPERAALMATAPR